MIRTRRLFNSLFRYRYRIFLIFVYLVGTWFRLSNLQNNVWSQAGYDESRDMLVAEHIVRYSETISSGPLAAGGLKWLKNSPVYFYLVSILWRFTRNPISFMYLWSLLMSLVVPISYFVGKNLHNRTTGIISAILFAVHNHLIFESRELLQPFLLPLFSLLFLLFLIIHIKRKNLFSLLLAIFFLLFPLHLHYGIFLSLPAGIGWLTYYYIKLVQKNNNWKNIVLPLITSFGLIGSWIVLTYRLFVFDQIYFLMFNFESKSEFIFSKLFNVINTFFNIIWSDTSWKLALLATTGLFLATVIYLFQLKKKPIRFKILLSFIASLMLAVIYNRNVASTYLLSILPYILVFYSIGISLLIKANKIFGWIVAGTIITIFYLQSTRAMSTLNEVSFFDQNYQVAQSIYKDYLGLTNYKNQITKSTPRLTIAVLTTSKSLPFDGWGTSGFWYHLENIFDQKLITLTNIGINHRPLVKRPQFIYLVCDHRINKELILEECYNRFISVRQYLVGENKEILKLSNYTVWRFNVDPNKIIGTGNYVYQDLLVD